MGGLGHYQKISTSIRHTLLRQLTQHYLTSNGAKSKQEAVETARSVLRWMQESEKCSVADDLHRMVREHTVQHKPLAYILGNQPFGQLDLLVEPPILIPRPETEEWVYKLINEIKSGGQDDRTAKVLDLCSGSGCISLALASELPRFQVTGVDINGKAIELAQKNARKNRVNNVVFKEVDLFDDQAMRNLKLGQFDVIVSNPPYIPPSEYLQLDKSVKDYEDPRALVGKRGVSEHGRMESTTESNEDALDFYRRIRELAIGLLVKREDRVVSHEVPQIVMEFGQGQAAQVNSIFSEFPCTIEVDFSGIPRSIRVYGQAMK